MAVPNARGGRSNNSPSAAAEAQLRVLEDIAAKLDQQATTNVRANETLQNLLRSTNRSLGLPTRGGPSTLPFIGSTDQTGRPIHSTPGANGYGSAVPTVHQVRHNVGNWLYGQSGMGDYVADQSTIHPLTGQASHFYHVSDYDESGQLMPGAESKHRSSLGASIGMARVGAGLSRGGAMGALKAVPYVGAAVAAGDAIYGGLKMIGNQREANSQYQSVFGGTNMAGMGQRFLQSGFKVGQLFSGGLTGGQADQAFHGVSALGFQGAARQSRLDFVTRNYKSMGMSVDESMQLVNTTSKDTSTNLNDLTKALKGVTEEAKKTGQNAQVLRQQLSDMMAINMASGMSGNTSTVISQGDVAMSSGMGRIFTKASTAGLSSQTSMLLQAQQSGMSYGQYVAAGMTDPGVIAGGRDKVTNWALTQAVGGQSGVEAVKAIIAKFGADKINADTNGTGPLKEAAVELLQSNILNPMLIQAASQSLGIDLSQMPPGDQAKYVIKFYASGGNMYSQQYQQYKDSHSMKSGASDQDLIKAGYGTQSMKVTSNPDGSTSATPNGINQTKHGEVYDWMTKNHVVDPALAGLASTYGENAKLQFSDGKTMKLKDAVNNAQYRSEIDSGTATLISRSKGDKKDGSLGDTVGQLGLASTGDAVGKNAFGSSATTANGVTVNIAGNPELLKKLGITVRSDSTQAAGATTLGAPAPGAATGYSFTGGN